MLPILKPYKLVSREFKPENTVVTIDGFEIGGPQIQIIAGPCAVESREVLEEIAEAIEPAGVHFLRGGAFKPRTSPYAFQGWGEKGLKFLAAVREKTGMKVVTELMDPRDTVLVCKYADIVQIGTRNMAEFQAPYRGRQHRQTGHFETGPLRDYKGIPHVGRIHHGAGKREGNPVRKGNPHL